MNGETISLWETQPESKSAVAGGEIRPFRRGKGTEEHHHNKAHPFDSLVYRTCGRRGVVACNDGRSSGVERWRDWMRVGRGRRDEKIGRVEEVVWAVFNREETVVIWPDRCVLVSRKITFILLFHCPSTFHYPSSLTKHISQNEIQCFFSNLNIPRRRRQPNNKGSAKSEGAERRQWSAFHVAGPC